MTEEGNDRLSDEEVNELLQNQASSDSIEDKYEKLGNILEEAEAEGSNIYASVKFPGGGVFRDGKQLDTAMIREMGGSGDMALMDIDSFDAKALRKIVLDCVESIGTLEDKNEIANILFRDLLIGDYLHLVFKVRQLSVGDEYEFQGECRNRECGHTGRYTVMLSDLEYENPVEPIEDERHRVDEFSKIPSQVFEVHWHFMTQGDSDYLDTADRVVSGDDSKEQQKTKARRADRVNEQKNIDVLTAQMISRVDKIVMPDGEEIVFGRQRKKRSDGALNIAKSVNFVRELPMWLRMHFAAKANKFEPGIDPEVEWDCESCGREDTHIIYPLAPAFFFQLGLSNG